MMDWFVPDWTRWCINDTGRASCQNVDFTHQTHHTRLTALFPGLPEWASTRKVKPIWILLKQETVSGSGISWDICKSAPRSSKITTPVPHHSVFYRPDALPAAQPTALKQWRKKMLISLFIKSPLLKKRKPLTKHWKNIFNFDISQQA